MRVSHLPLALRAFTEIEGTRKRRERRHVPGPAWPEHILIFDTETTTDRTQRLLFGTFLFGRWEGGRIVPLQEGIIYPDDLAKRCPDGMAALRRYAHKHPAQVDPVDGDRRMALKSRSEFAELLWNVGRVLKGAIVGFNLPFDISRIALRAGRARGRYRGGFSFVIAGGVDQNGEVWENRYRSRIVVNQIDNKRAFMRFTKPKAHDRRNGRWHSGHFLDLRTLTFALTARGHSLASACKAFGVDEGKHEIETYGVINEDSIAYAVQDVRISARLLERCRAEFDSHPIELSPMRAYSPASIAKAYLRKIGVERPLEQFDVSRNVLGYAMSAYYGGRAECRIRRAVVPVVTADFASMYPTVNALMGLWDLMTAERLEVRDVTETVQEFLRDLTWEDASDPDTWNRLRFFAKVRPDGHTLPVRAEYDTSRNTNIGWNPLHSDGPLWYSGPDVVAATLIHGKPPEIHEAFELMPVGRQDGLRPIKFADRAEIDPATQDFFKAVIELRKSLDKLDLAPEEAKRLDLALKIVANAGSYGVFAEMNPQTSGEDQDVTIYGAREPFAAVSRKPETPGEYCFPPFAALTTGGARLMLALAENTVSELGGVHAFCDTDSLAIVATEAGGLVPCPGGPYRTGGQPAVRALSYADVEAVRARFDSLNPYDPRIVPSILELEGENYADGERVQLYAFAISAKRYVLLSR